MDSRCHRHPAGHAQCHRERSGERSDLPLRGSRHQRGGQRPGCHWRGDSSWSLCSAATHDTCRWTACPPGNVERADHDQWCCGDHVQGADPGPLDLIVGARSWCLGPPQHCGGAFDHHHGLWLDYLAHGWALLHGEHRRQLLGRTEPGLCTTGGRSLRRGRYADWSGGQLDEPPGSTRLGCTLHDGRGCAHRLSDPLGGSRKCSLHCRELNEQFGHHLDADGSF